MPAGVAGKFPLSGLLRGGVCGKPHSGGDSAGQSRHVDDYMGGQGSAARQRAAANFRKMRDSIDNCKSQTDIDNLFDI